jgi:hypothetical protein
MIARTMLVSLAVLTLMVTPNSARTGVVACPATEAPTIPNVQVTTVRGDVAKMQLEELYRSNPVARAQHEENLRAILAHGGHPTEQGSYMVLTYRTAVPLRSRLMNLLAPTLHAQAFSLDGDATLYWSEGDDWAEVTISGSAGTISGTFICCQGPAPWPPTPDWSWPPWVGRFANCAMGWCLGGCISSRGNIRGCGLSCGGAIAACGYNEYANYRLCRSNGKRSDEC